MGKTIGILGGMGPEATSYLFELIIENTKASRDQEHIPIVIYSNPKIPPRTEAILGKGPSPLPHLLEGVDVLERAGADFIVIPCVTAHYYYPDLVREKHIPILSLLEESVQYMKEHFPGVRKAGLVASKGTHTSGLFHKTFARESIEVIAPSEEEQEQVMEAIFGEEGIKASFTSGKPREIIRSIARKLVERGAEAVIAGCTEIPLVLRADDLSVPYIEPLRIIALASIKRAGYTIQVKSKK